MTEESFEQIAIIGMSGRFPGAASIEELWENLVAGKESIRDFSPEELAAAGVDPDLYSRSDYVSRGAPLDGAKNFDAAFFGYTRRDAELMDPQHRVFLECAWSALEDAGIDSETQDGRIGIFGGVAPNTYRQAVLETRPDLLEMSSHFSLVISGEREHAITRPAFKLGLNGPAVSVNAASSTSGVALHLACQSVLSGECDVALAGGATVLVPLTEGYVYQEDGILSPDGHCRAFDADARGTVVGSGVGIVVLKRLSDAIRDDDHIRAVIRSTAINNDGSDKVGYSAPSVSGQEAVIREALDLADISAETIGYVEAHGTGTFIGDPIELDALTRAFRHDTEATQYCAIGSIKTNIGHLSAAAAIAGLIKAVLVVETGMIPPSLHFRSPNPQIDFDSSPFRVADRLITWPAELSPRRAAISSFGLGGTNAHIIVEQPPERPVRHPIAEPANLLVVSASSTEALDRITERLADHLEADTTHELGDVAYTLTVGRRHLNYRRAVAGENRELATKSLRESVKRPVREPTAARPVLFMFPGGGAQHIGMGHELYLAFDQYRRPFDQCADLLVDRVGVDLRDLVFGDGSADLQRPVYGLTTLFACEYATAQMLRYFGIQPELLIGHSLGEYAAACIAGVMSLEDALEMVTVRGELFESLPPGGMLSVPLPPGDLAQYLGDNLSIAVVNKPDLSVVAGDDAALDDLEGLLSRQSVETRRIRIGVAAHSHMVEPILDEFAEAAARIDYSSPEISIVSNLTGEIMGPDTEIGADYWVDHLRNTVRFVDGLSAALSGDPKLAIEVGPGQTLSSYARQNPGRTRGQVIVPTLPHQSDHSSDASFFLGAVGSIWSSGASVDLTRQFTYPDWRVISLPTYSFEPTQHWVTPSSRASRETMQAQPASQTETVEEAGLGPEQSEDRLTRIQSAITSLLSDLSGLAPEELDPGATFLEHGFDSLFLTQANHHFRKEFGVRISFRQLFDEAPTISALAEFIAGEMPPDAFAIFESQSSPEPTPVAETGIVQPTESPTTSQDLSSDRPHSFLAQVINDQLRVMEQQLMVLGNGTPTPVSQPERSHQGSSSEERPRRRHYLSSSRDEKDGTSTSRSDLSERQAAALDSLVRRYNARTPSSKRLADLWRPHLADNRTIVGFDKRWKELVYQIVSDRSLGSRIWDVDGNEYVDLAMGFGTNLFGHSPSFVVEAVHEQLDRGFEVGVQNQLLGDVAGMVCAATDNERMTFAYSGGEAVEVAIRLARAVTGRDKAAYFTDDIHGRSDVVLGRGIDGPGGFRTTPAVVGVPQAAVDLALVLEYGTERALEIIRSQAHELALVLVEPVRSRNPDLQPVGFLKELRSMADDHGFLLVFDEVVTGFRAHLGGVQALFDVKADITTYGKVLGGGLPIGAVAGAGDHIDLIDGGRWSFGDGSFPEADITASGGTLIKHPLSLVAAAAVLEHLEDRSPSLQADLNRRTTEAVEAINEAYSHTGIPIHVEHFSSFFRPFFLEGRTFADLFQYYLREHGVHTNPPGSSFLSTAHTEHDMDVVVAAYIAAGNEMVRDGFLEPNKRSGLATPVIAEHNSVEDGERIAPLTSAQQEIWLASQLGDATNCAYNVGLTLRITGELDAEALVECVHALVARHEALRTTILSDGLTQRIVPRLALDIPFVDLGHLTDAERSQRLEELTDAEVVTPFDLEKGPLVRANLVGLAPRDHILILTFHHVVCDGWSTGVVVRDLAELYTAAVEDRRPSLDAPMQLSEYARWQKEYESGEEWREDAEFWKDTIKPPFPVTEVPADHPRPAMKTYGARRKDLLLDPTTVERLREVASATGVTMFTVMLSAFEVYLHRLTGDEEIAIGVNSAGQAQFAGQDLVGHCVNMLPMRRPVAPEWTFEEHLQTTYRALFDALDHQNFSYGSLVKELSELRDRSRTPLVGVIFNMDTPRVPLEFGVAVGQTASIPRQFENFDLFATLQPIRDTYNLEWTYNEDLYDEASIQRYMQGYAALLGSIATDSDRKLDELYVMSESDRRTLSEWNDTAIEYDTDTTLHGLFERQVAEEPNAVAIVFRGEELTYAELNARANSLARLLLDDLSDSRALVGVFMDRSIEMVVALYAILKAGAAYVPLDPEYPEDRLRFMIEETGMPIILTQEHLENRLPDSTGSVCVVGDSWTRFDLTNLDRPVSPSDTAYVMYTSGSTGRPKGVVISHRSICNQMQWAQDYIALGATDSILQKTPFNFDVSTLEFFWPLMAGSRLVIAEPGGHRDPRYLIRTIVEHEITLAHFVPSMLRFFLEDPEVANCASLTYVICIGEAVTVDLQDRFFERLNSRLFNLYGPTEAAVTCTYWECEHGVDPVPIGRPVANTQIHIVDAELHPVPIGVKGELTIGGVQVADGYLKRPELTRERFVPDPFTDQPGARLYRTGDLGRYRPDGNIEFLGRADYQVKIRGNRVELGEIEATLELHPDVAQAVCVVSNESLSEERLVAFTIVNESWVVEADLREFLRKRLPDYMIPSQIVQLDEFPMTTNGKVDRNDLIANHRPSAAATRSGEVPRTPLEQDIAAVWCDVLGVESVGVTDDFFDMGGHSLDAMRVNARLREYFDVDLSLGSFFEEPTVEGQALAVTEKLATQLAGDGDLERLVSGITGPGVNLGSEGS